MDETTNSSSAPPNPKIGDEKAADLVRQRLHNLYEEHKEHPAHDPAPTQGYHNPYKTHIFSNRPDPAKDRKAYDDWYYTLSPEQQYQEWQNYYVEHHKLQHKSTSQVVRDRQYSTFDLPNDASPKEIEKKAQFAYNLEEKQRKNRLPDTQTVGEMKNKIVSKVAAKSKSMDKTRLKPLITAAIVGFIFLFINFNDLLVGQLKLYLSPGSQVVSPSIVDPNAVVAVSEEPRIIIPKINVDVPVVYDITTFEDKEIQGGLKRGVVHYGTTALPGQAGNNVIVGHSSSNFFNTGDYKFAFVLLDRLEVGDTFTLHYEGQRYIYKVNKKEIIAPTDFSLIQPTAVPTTTLITCSPPGTNWRRLVIQAEQISPDPSTAEAVNTEIPEDIESTVPGDSQTPWGRLWDWIF